MEEGSLSQIISNLKGYSSKLIRRISKIIELNSRLLQTHIRTEKMTGGTSATRLRVRSGHLRRSVQVKKVDLSGGNIRGGVTIGGSEYNVRYARVHIGRRGQKTIIKPKRAKFLTVPLKAALTPSGVLKGPARSNIWGDTFVAKTAQGRLVIFGRGRIMKGERQGELRSKILPLFLLLKQVTVPARIHPAELLGWIRPKILADMKSGKFKGV